LTPLKGNVIAVHRFDEKEEETHVHPQDDRSAP